MRKLDTGYIPTTRGALEYQYFYLNGRMVSHGLCNYGIKNEIFYRGFHKYDDRVGLWREGTPKQRVWR